ncbi:transcription termination factor MTERF8, chloroplastic [Punica granatum]|uniref:Transcription termination factor MTERF8, chloroplastic n=1 Tax=Punica granatum TaxID=22663 RepID=A0A218XRB9_PUNGR|nr:transcription termination factor MTERF8, chloroplastic [Punica granatum]OWM87216.1 hypothetical protein CDL15_Pgr010248 [Punica granatum]
MALTLVQHFRHFRPGPSSSSSSSSSSSTSFSFPFPFTALFPLNKPNSAKPPRLFIFRPLSSKRSAYATAATDDKSLSFTADYLVQSCGLTPAAAAAASQRVQFSTPEKPDSVLALLRSHGFSNAQISKLVNRRPSLLLATPESSLLPKLEFFYSIGVSRSELAKILSRDPTPLCRSLQNQILPSYEFLLGFLESDKKIISAMRRTSWVFLLDYTKNLAPNMEHLSKLGVPKSCLSLLFAHFPEALLKSHEEFVENAREVVEMGFDLKKTVFVLAVHVISGKGNRAIMERCKEVYARWGWSEDDIKVAFRKHPNCMILSEKKIDRTMEYLVNEMKLPARRISQCPAILFFSLEKRIIPRCEVIKVLLKKGLLKRDFSLSTFLLPPEERFLDRFVEGYQEEAPELMSVLRRKRDSTEAQ